MSAMYMVAMLVASTIAWEYDCVEGSTPRGMYVTCTAGEEPIVLCSQGKCRASDGYEYDVATIIAALSK